MELSGICQDVVRTKTRSFFNLKHYDSNVKQFVRTRICLVGSPEKIYAGAWVSAHDLQSTHDKLGNLMYITTNVTLLTRSIHYPNNFKKNELTDLETRFKSRLRDFHLNDSSLNKLNFRYNSIEYLKSTFKELGFLNVDLPILELNYGGASAKPCTTRILDVQKEYFLRISLEFPLLKHISIGFPSVFSIGSVFRNESLDHTHSPEFTLMESMTTDPKKDLKFHIDLTEKIYRDLYYSYTHSYVKNGFDLRNSWRIYTKSEIQQLCTSLNCTDLQELQKLGHLEPFHHITGFPLVLAKSGELRIESYVDYSTELCHFYVQQTELEVLKDVIDECSDILSPDFKRTLEAGVPPCLGWGIGVDRLIASITDAQSVREVQFAPLY